MILIRHLRSLTLWSIGLLLLTTSPAQAASKNGFDLSGSLVPQREIAQGGPPRDGIPALDSPTFIAANEARYLRDSDRVLGLTINGDARAYPIRILNWHELVNDDVGGTPVLVSYCPLCGTGMVFKAKVAGEARTFGVSGLLYASDVLMYDRQSESLWSQLLGQAVTGPLKGTRLSLLTSQHTTWGDWRRQHPNTRVMSDKIRSGRNYSRDPYAGYENSRSLFFPVKHMDGRFHPKEWVLGLEIKGRYVAYPFSQLALGGGELKDTYAGVPLRIVYDADAHSARALDADGNELPSVRSYWFAWVAFHPGTEVYRK